MVLRVYEEKEDWGSGLSWERRNKGGGTVLRVYEGKENRYMKWMKKCCDN